MLNLRVCISRQAFKVTQTFVRSLSNGLPPDCMYIPMPKLSPTMKSGTVTKWLKKEGVEVSGYDLVFEISTDTLYAPGEGPEGGGSTGMLIELAEDGFMGKIFVEEGQTVKVGEALAILCEEKSSLDATSSANSPDFNLYGKDGSMLRMAIWQGYLSKEKEKQEKDGRDRV